MRRENITRAVAKVVFLSMVYQLIYPNASYALTSGPSQPEVQSFEPVGTTDMVDLFSGDFVYNIPLLDVDGYPVNISYHSGVNTEQEASWVGLGWNINAGVINRAVRGMPDDFNGDVIEREVNIHPEKNVKVSAGGNIEFFGGGFNLMAGIYVNSSNYRGLSAGTSIGASVSAFGFASAGVNMGISSQGGADIDYDASVGYSTSNSMSREFACGIGLNGSGGYNTRNGVKDFTVNVSANYKTQFNNKKVSGHGSLFSATLPISLQNYVPVITNTSEMNGFGASIGLGGEAYGMYFHGYLGLTMSKLEYDANGNKNGYGYLYLDNAQDEDIVDFTRDKDGMFNKTMEYLPAGNMTYDVYSASAQGTGGIFRPFRNDFGFVYDPATGSSNKNTTVGLEIGLGNTLEIGANTQTFHTDMNSGPWSAAKRKFLHKKINGSIFENVYFRQAGELTEVSDSFYAGIKGIAPIPITSDSLQLVPSVKAGSTTSRDPRGNLIYYLTNREAGLQDTAGNQFAYSTRQIENYTDTNGLINGPNVLKTLIDRENSTTRKKDRIAEIVQVNKDGSRYVYGLPALNNVQKEASFSINGSSSGIDKQRGVVSYTSDEDSMTNPNKVEHFYSMTVTPSYAHSYLLTNVLSADYVDVSNNGPSDDDLGTYVKFNYSRKEADYRWKVPYASGKANHSPGFYCDKQDDKANYIIGSKELWYMHSIETKNFVAEFYVSKRSDGKGVTDKVLPGNSEYKSGGYSSEAYNSTVSTPASSYKLDSIKLYNKHDRFLNQGSAVPIKSVFFEYNYSLCTHTSNSYSADSAKLTLKKIYMSYGNSDKNLLSPYQFSYYSPPGGYAQTYDIACKDRWGNYKPNDANAPNFEFPYVSQADPAKNDVYASLWQLTQVTLPSGGVLTVSYESDDYAYVQDRRAMEMFKVDAVGSTPDYYPNESTLYQGKSNPYNYVYFTRRTSAEYNSDFWDVYLNGDSTLYYNFGIDIASKGTYEAVRGYANVEEIGACSDGIHGYIKVKGKTPTGSGAYVNPMVYTGLNMARYYLPHLFYPGSDPDESNLTNILQGLASAAGDLIHIFQNPIDHFLKQNKARNYDKNKSVVRLYNPNLKKKGGGARVKEIRINDKWNAMSGGDNAVGEFGNKYEYTLSNQKYGQISSGVASYEPLIGGDENPFRQPASYYKAAKGTKFPPNDPVELFQEDPMGESLYPPASVGYSFVKVSSIHKDIARSAQTEDEYEFYTAKDFPVRVEATEIKKDEEEKKGMFKSKMNMMATQAYSIVMNDMHGKPKAIRNYAIKHGDAGTFRETVTSQTFVYNRNGNTLNNKVDAFYVSGGQIVKGPKILGQEIDVTVDSRQREENTHIVNLFFNLNAFIFGVFPIEVPTLFFPPHDHERNFHSLVCTKVVQQYGILKGVETIKDGAKVFAENKVYNAQTGDVLLTKVNDEFGDPQYQMNYPAYWGYDGMGPSYKNVGVEDSARLVFVWGSTFTSNYRHILSQNPASYCLGDELLIHTVSPSSVSDRYFKAWVNGFEGGYPTIVGAYSMGTHSASYGGFIPTTNMNRDSDIVVAYVKILRSGRRNMLGAPLQTTTSVDDPSLTGFVSFGPSRVIDTKVTTYSDALTKLFPWHASVASVVATSDTNMFLFGYRGNYRLASEYVYLTERGYSPAHARLNGTFPIATSYWLNNGFVIPNTVGSSLSTFWKQARSVTAYNAWGNELENEDALKIPSSALFGFNYAQPVAVANNARYYELLSEGFEDFRILQLFPFINSGNPAYSFSPFKPLFSYGNPSQLSPSTLYKFYSTTATNLELSTAESHTGYYSLKVTGGTPQLDIKTSPQTKLNDFNFQKSKRYVISCWAKRVSGTSTTPGVAVIQLDASSGTISNAGITLSAKTNMVDGWVQYEGTLDVKSNAATVRLSFPANFYYDDFRVYPANANMKAFVYNPVNQKLIATLDENNFATFYEYDNEGQLIRINKETERGILTVQESRGANAKP